MACRTIRSERERRAAAMLTPFMPCGAKLPVIALFAGAFFSDASWVGKLMYFVGIALIFFGAVAYLIRAKKRGVKCVGCPSGGTCPGCGGRCTGWPKDE